MLVSCPLAESPRGDTGYVRYVADGQIRSTLPQNPDATRIQLTHALRTRTSPATEDVFLQSGNLYSRVHYMADSELEADGSTIEVEARACLPE